MWDPDETDIDDMLEQADLARDQHQERLALEALEASDARSTTAPERGALDVPNTTDGKQGTR